MRTIADRHKDCAQAAAGLMEAVKSLSLSMALQPSCLAARQLVVWPHHWDFVRLSLSLDLEFQI